MMNKITSILVLLCFLINSQSNTAVVYAQEFALPSPGIRVPISPAYNPLILRGIKVHPDNPLLFDFILDKGDLPNKQLDQETLLRLIKYFLASLTIPQKDLWVNLSPYEKKRIVPTIFGQTEMGRDLLAEDYMLKQITASLIYPEGEIGRQFWHRVYAQVVKRYGTSDIPVNTFNKVWIVPQKAVIYENTKSATAYIVESKLKVMLEQDYFALEKKKMVSVPNNLGSQILREIIIPELDKEVNEGKNFAPLRQVYNSLILATWYKKKVIGSILGQVYEDKNKVVGILSSPNPFLGDPEQIYQRYIQAFKKGVYNFIKEESDSVGQERLPRKYFSGGADLMKLPLSSDSYDQAQSSLADLKSRALILTVKLRNFKQTADAAMRVDLQWPQTSVDERTDGFDGKMATFYIPELSNSFHRISPLGFTSVSKKLPQERFELVFGLLRKLADDLGIGVYIAQEINGLKVRHEISVMDLELVFVKLNKELINRGWVIHAPSPFGNDTSWFLLWDKVDSYENRLDDDGNNVWIILVDDRKGEPVVGQSMIHGMAACSFLGGKYILLSKLSFSDKSLRKQKQDMLSAPSGPYKVPLNLKRKLKEMSDEKFAAIFRKNTLVEEWTHDLDKKRLGKEMAKNVRMPITQAVSIILSARGTSPIEDLISDSWLSYVKQWEQKGQFNYQDLLMATLELRAYMQRLMHVSSEDEFVVEYARAVNTLILTPPNRPEYYLYVIPLRFILWAIEQVQKHQLPLDRSDVSGPFKINSYDFLFGHSVYEKVKPYLPIIDKAMNSTVNKRHALGGIDLGLDRALNIENSGQAIVFNLNTDQLVDWQACQGLSFDVISLRSISDLNGFFRIN